MTMRITHIGGPTALIEVGGWRILTDPTFDAPGRRYNFGWGTSSRKLGGQRSRRPTSARSTPSCSATTTTTTTSTPPAARCCRAPAPSSRHERREAARRRLAQRPRPLATTRLDAPGKTPIEITATPCRHGPPLSRPIVGDVIGFALRWEGQQHGAVWISGDTVLYDGVREVPTASSVGTAILHLGGVRFPISGSVPLHDDREGRRRAHPPHKPHTAIPIHYECWKHFREGRDTIERELGAAPPDVRDRFRWIPIGSPVELEA